jgi:hypothetical protein
MYENATPTDRESHSKSQDISSYPAANRGRFAISQQRVTPDAKNHSLQFESRTSALDREQYYEALTQNTNAPLSGVNQGNGIDEH